jgi:cytochrome c peroxidase
MTRQTTLKALVLIAGIAFGSWFLASPSTWTTEAADNLRGYELPFSEELALLGDQIFDDQNLSIGRNQACNTCHSAAWGFTGPDPNINAHGAVYEGSIPGRFGDRKPPSSAYSTISPVFHFSKRAGGLFVGGNFWDGRATGERLGNPAVEQAQGPFLNPFEQGLRDEACVVYRVANSEDYGALYRELWGNAIDLIVYPDNIDILCEEEGRDLISTR